MGKVSEYVEAAKKAEAMKPRAFYLKDDPNTWAASFDVLGLLHLHANLSPLCAEDAHRLMLWLSENL